MHETLDHRASDRARQRGIRDAVALLTAVIPLGFATGVALGDLSGSWLVTWLGAPLLVAGASHLVLVGQLDAGATAMAAGLAAIVVNSRFIVYGAGLAPWFRSQPRWFRIIGPHWVVDQTYALTVGFFADGPPAGAAFRRYFANAAVVLWLAWSVSVGVGLTVGSALPAEDVVGLVVPTMFLGLLGPTLRSRGRTMAAAAGVCTGFLVPGTNAPVAAAALAGVVVGLLATEDRS